MRRQLSDDECSSSVHRARVRVQCEMRVLRRARTAISGMLRRARSSQKFELPLWRGSWLVQIRQE